MRKSDTLYNWKRRGLIADNIDEIYDRYINATHCEKCNIEFKDKRYMDHCHKTGKFRNILCNSCNMCDEDIAVKGKIKIKYISKFRNGYQFQKTVNRVRHHKTFKTLDEAIKYKDEFLANLNL